ncbi:MAG: hypothetical protein KDI88_07455 [Gammaproteobacteria bacterium]|nr:hypothetical protein [Gammaproteobacteria bacterium]
MPDPDDRVSEIYQASRQRLEPPGELDRRILDEAHRAVERRQRLPYRSLALAATVVLGVGLAWLQLHTTQIVEDATAPRPESMVQPATGDADHMPANKRREAPAPSLPSLPDIRSPAGLSVAPVAPPPPARQRQIDAVRSRPYADGEALTTAPEADISAAAEAGGDAEQALPGPGAPCGLATRPTDRAAWLAALRDAETRGDAETLACLRRAMREALDGALP